MITFLFIFIAAFFKSISDTIRVPEVMKSSYFSKFVGHWYIDPQISWKNKDKIIFPLSYVAAPFSDLWHLTQTLMISFLLAPALWLIVRSIYIHDFATHFHWTICFAWIVCWFASFEFWYSVWKKDLPEKSIGVLPIQNTIDLQFESEYYKAMGHDLIYFGHTKLLPSEIIEMYDIDSKDLNSEFVIIYKK